MEKGMTQAQRMATGPTLAPSWQYLYKPLTADGTKTAVLMMNHGDSAVDLTLNFIDIPGVQCTTCNVRDIWNHKDLGSSKTSFVAKAVGPHDCAFVIITPASESSLVV